MIILASNLALRSSLFARVMEDIIEPKQKCTTVEPLIEVGSYTIMVIFNFQEVDKLSMEDKMASPKADLPLRMPMA